MTDITAKLFTTHSAEPVFISSPWLKQAIEFVLFK